MLTKRTTFVLSLVLIATVASCGGGGIVAAIQQFIASQVVANADWNNAVRQTVTLTENPDGSLAFTPADLNFQAEVPVILTIQNPAGNTSKHYYTAADFYKSVAWRKAQTSHGEYKAPYFKAFELLVGGSIELYFVPIVPGVYNVICTIPGHAAAGMTGTITVTGDAAAIDQEVSPTWNPALENDARTSGGHAVWATAQEVQIQMDEVAFPNNLAFSTTPRYAVGQGYICKIKNPAGNQSKHYYTAKGFNETCVIRKAQDTDAEIKVPYFNAVELLVDAANDKELEMYIVPTVAGQFQSTCTIGGHAAAGMDHTFTVDAAGTAASTLIPPGAQWPAAPTHTVTMVENPDGSLAFQPANLNFAVGDLVILRVTNPAGNVSKHYYTASDFYKSVAWRKVQTSQGEYKAPYFKAVELLIGGTIDLYFVPQIPGSYDVVCTIPGHATLGMNGTITVTGNATNSLDLEVSPTWDPQLDTDPRTSGGDPVWAGAVALPVTISEAPFSYVPANPNLTAGTGYVVTVTNPGPANSSKHYYWSPAFFETCVTRKFQDVDAEIKAPYFNGVELLWDPVNPKMLEMYIVPVKPGPYKVWCTIVGHEAAGMTGTITVQ